MNQVVDLGLDFQFLVVGSILLGDLESIRTLVKVGVLLRKPDGEGLDASRRRSRHGRDNPAGVDAPREENAQGDIGDQVAADRVIEPLAESCNPFRLGQAGAGSRLETPVSMHLERVAGILDQEVPRRQFPGLAEDRPRGRDVEQREVLIERDLIERKHNIGDRPKTLQLAHEIAASILLQVVKRLDPKSVPGGEHPPGGPVVDGKSEHAPQPLDRPITVLLVEVDDNLGVRSGREPMAPLDQVALQLPVIVDLPVEDDGQRAILIEDGLSAALQVDDAQAAHPQADTA